MNVIIEWNSAGFSFSLTFLSSLFLFCIFLVILETSLSKSEFIDFFCWNNGFLICVVVNLEYGSMTGDFITTLKLISVISFSYYLLVQSTHIFRNSTGW